jgi:predicted DCC family thiol-disulfide oxidoreductase YuxK
MDTIVFYDGTCPFCVYSATKLKKLDWMNKLMILDLYTPGILEKYNIPLEKAMKRIQVVENGNVRKEGMEALLLIAGRLPLLWIFIPFFWLSIKLGLGSKIYDWIAKNRFLFPMPGYCPIPDSESDKK